jgi:biotin carboxyl carrier protein
VVTVSGKRYEVKVEENSGEISSIKEEQVKSVSTGMEIKTNLSENIYSIVATQGARVKKGDILLIIEAMKMENSILSPADGVLEEILVHKGDSVKDGQTLAILKV